MSTLRPQLRAGGEWFGGILGYPLERLYEEVAFVAFHFHWSADSVLGMEHADRRRWVAEISAINERRNEGSPT